MRAIETREIRLNPAMGVPLCLGFFVGRDDFSAAQVRRTQENSLVREHWDPRVGSVSPGTGRKNRPARIFRPVPGLANWLPEPTAVRHGLVSFALRALVPGAPFAACRHVGQDGILRAGWQPALGAGRGREFCQ